MRLPRNSVLFLLLLTTVCMLAGVVLGILTGQPFVAVPQPPTATRRPTLAPTATGEAVLAVATTAPAIPATPGAQKSILVVAVNDAQADSPSLEACWVITFRAGVPEYYVLSFPPSASFELASLSGRQTLAGIYQQDRQLQLEQRLLSDAIQARFPGLGIDAILVVDRAELGSLVDRLGGLFVGGQTLSASSLFATYDAWPAEDLQSRLRFQDLAFQAALQRLNEQGWSPATLADHFKQQPRLALDRDASAALDQFVADAPPLGTATLVWRSYTPEMELGSLP